MQSLPDWFRYHIMIIVAVNSLLTYLFEKIAVWHISQWWKARKDKIYDNEKQKELEELESHRIGAGRDSFLAPSPN